MVRPEPGVAWVIQESDMADKTPKRPPKPKKAKKAAAK
jgi:hypothetical protein